MKKYVLSCLLLASFSQAYAGTAYIPKFTHSSTGNWCVTISNISNINISVTVKAFVSTGAIYNGPSSTNGITSQFNTPFNLEPNQTTLLCTTNISGGAQHGYAVVSGSPADAAETGNSFLVASAHWAAGSHLMNIPVNAGLPF